MLYVIEVCWQLASRIASCQQTCMTYTIVVCTVKNSWWWTEELSETCRVLFQKWICETSASSWFYYKNFTSRMPGWKQTACAHRRPDIWMCLYHFYCYPQNLTIYESHVNFIIHNLYCHQKVNIITWNVSLLHYRIQTGHENKAHFVR